MSVWPDVYSFASVMLLQCTFKYLIAWCDSCSDRRSYADPTADNGLIVPRLCDALFAQVIVET